METNSNHKRRYINKLRSKYRLSIYNDKSYEEVWHMRLSRLNVISFVSIVSFLGVAGVVTLIAFTPLRELIPGYPDSETRSYIIQNAFRLDSLEKEVRSWTLYNDNLGRILSGQDPIEIEGVSDTIQAERYNAIVLANSVEDSIFRREVEQIEMQSKLLLSANSNRPQVFSNLHFFPPVRGRVIEKLNKQSNKFDIKIGATAGSAIMSSLNGTVMAVYWTAEFSYVMHIQHDFNVITVYKNCEEVLKRTGDFVKAGEAIGIIGVNKERQYLGFEIWNSGTPIDPEQYIVF
ncbi:MAG: murein hydrolase activator EnvC family protein [Bacteroidales bacterium]